MFDGCLDMSPPGLNCATFSETIVIIIAARVFSARVKIRISSRISLRKILFLTCEREEKNSRDSLFSLFTRAENTRAAIIITSSTTIIMKGNPKESPGAFFSGAGCRRLAFGCALPLALADARPRRARPRRWARHGARCVLCVLVAARPRARRGQRSAPSAGPTGRSTLTPSRFSRRSGPACGHVTHSPARRRRRRPHRPHDGGSG